MSIGWPRWLAFFALAAFTWWALGTLDPDRNRLGAAAYGQLAGELKTELAAKEAELHRVSKEEEEKQACSNLCWKPLDQAPVPRGGVALR